MSRVDNRSWWLRNLARTLTWVGRHSAPALSIPVHGGGWIEHKDLKAKCISFGSGRRFGGVELSDVQEALAAEPQKRVEVESSGPFVEDWRFRAVQGHSFEVPRPELLFRPLPDQVTVGLHYTGPGALRRILKTGSLRRMDRTHIHLKNAGIPSVDTRDSVRLRERSVAIEINLHQARETGCIFALSQNDAILTRGNSHGAISAVCFWAVWTKDPLMGTWTRYTMDEIYQWYGLPPMCHQPSSTSIADPSGSNAADLTNSTPSSTDANSSSCQDLAPRMELDSTLTTGPSIATINGNAPC